MSAQQAVEIVDCAAAAAAAGADLRRRPPTCPSQAPHAALPVQVRRSDVLSAWSGLRPLALDPNAKDTASASRDHVVTRDPDGMITVTGAFCCGLARGFYACRPCAFPGCPLQAHHLIRADYFVRAACLSWCAGMSGDLCYSASLHCCTSSRSHDTAFAPGCHEGYEIEPRGYFWQKDAAD